jgi:ferritin
VTTLRNYSSLDEALEALLNEQLGWEVHCSSLYLAMCAWCKTNGYKEAANFFSSQAEEERSQAKKLLDYMRKRGGVPKIAERVEIHVNFNSLYSVFEQVLQKEMHATFQLNCIAKECIKISDFVTFQFLQSLLYDQVDKEHIAKRILELIIKVGEAGTSRTQIDSQVLDISWGFDVITHHT